MKTSLKSIACAFVAVVSMSVSSFGNAPGDEPQKKEFAIAMFPASQESKVWLSLEKYNTKAKISIQLLDEKGKVVFREEVSVKAGKSNGIRQQFDLSEIGDGQYTFRISDGNQVEERTFKLSSPTVSQQQPVRLISMN